MNIDKTGKPAPYLTKVQRIAVLEAALRAVGASKSHGEALAIAKNVQGTGRRWQKPSPLSHEAMLAEMERQGITDLRYTPDSAKPLTPTEPTEETNNA